MIAMIALLATVLPNVGPIDLAEKLRSPNRALSAVSAFWSASGRSVLAEIWNPWPPMFLLVIFWIFAVGSFTDCITSVTWLSFAGFTKAVWMRVADLKSIPTLRS